MQELKLSQCLLQRCHHAVQEGFGDDSHIVKIVTALDACRQDKGVGSGIVKGLLGTETLAEKPAAKAQLFKLLHLPICL